MFRRLFITTAAVLLPIAALAAVEQWSTNANSNTAAPPLGAPENAAPSTINDTMREMMASVAIEAQINRVKVLNSVSGTNTITASMTPALTAYSLGMMVVLTPAVTNTGATTLAINGLLALDVQKFDGDALAAGDLVLGVPALLMLDAGADDWLLVNPQVGLGDFARLSQNNTFAGGGTSFIQTINGNTATTNALLRLQLNGSDAITLCASGVAGQCVIGDADGDTALRWSSGTFRLSADGGTSSVADISAATTNLKSTTVQVNGQNVRDTALFASGTLPVARGGTGTTTSTGTGSVVLSASPTLTGTVTAATVNATTLQQGGSGVWTAANDGSGSGLDADLLDGQSSAAFAAIDSGSFTMTLTGCTANPNVGAEYYITGTGSQAVVTLMIPSVSCTSNASTATLTGLPAAIQPSAQGGIQTCVPIRNNTAHAFGYLQLQVGSPTMIDLGAACGTSGGFTAAGTKGTNGGGPLVITYPLQ